VLKKFSTAPPIDRGSCFCDNGSRRITDLGNKKKMSQEKIQRNKKVVKLYKTKKYTMRSLGRIFKISHPRVIAILKEYAEHRKFKKKKN